MKIHLKCCCGAEITLVSDWESDARKYADDWQERHKDCKPVATVQPVAPLWQHPWTPMDYKITCEGTAK